MEEDRRHRNERVVRQTDELTQKRLKMKRIIRGEGGLNNI